MNSPISIAGARVVIGLAWIEKAKEELERTVLALDKLARKLRDNNIEFKEALPHDYKPTYSDDKQA